MHYSAKRGTEIACRPSVCLSVRRGEKWRAGAQKRQYLWNAQR